MTKPFHAGRAAESGVLAASLAAAGFTAAMQHPRGAARLLPGRRREATTLRPISGCLGRPWTFVEPGHLHQAASVGFAHASRDGRLPRPRARSTMCGRLGRQARAGRARTGTCPTRSFTTGRSTSCQAKFSMEFCLAILLLERRRRAGRSSPTRWSSDRTCMSHDRTGQFEADPPADEGGFREMTSLIERGAGRRTNAAHEGGVRERQSHEPHARR